MDGKIGYIDMSDRAMLVYLNMGVFGGKKKDREESQRVAQERDIDPDYVSVMKYLLKAKEFKAVEQARNAARSFHYANTLPWSDDGWRVLAASRHTSYFEGMRELEATFWAAVDALADNWDELLEDARSHLGKAFKERDYPSKQGLRERMKFRILQGAMPSTDFRCKLSDQDVERVRQEMEQRLGGSQANMMGDLLNQLGSTVGHMAKTLGSTDPKTVKGFHDTLVENVRHVADLLKDFNLVNDPKLEEIRLEIEEKLVRHPKEVLKDDAPLRKQVAKDSAAILKKVENLRGLL